MAYWGYFEFVKGFLADIYESKKRAPAILEVGVDKGQMILPLVTLLSKACESFVLVGCDINFRDELVVNFELIRDFCLKERQHFIFIEDSSLNYLPRVLEEVKKVRKEHFDSNIKLAGFDLILLDGDHNYFTVSKELKYISELLNTGGVIIADDYGGGWAKKDQFFSEYKGYEDNTLATKRADAENKDKKGVMAAIDEFIENNPDWEITDGVHPEQEPVLLFRKGEVLLANKKTGETIDLEDKDQYEKMKKEYIEDKKKWNQEDEKK